MKKKQNQVEAGSNGKEKQDNRRVIRIIICALIVAILLLLMHRCSMDQSQNPIKPGIINVSDVTDVQQYINDKVEAGMFQVFINTDILVNSGNMANLLIQNAETNHYAVYVDIYHENEILYQSATIEPGYKLEQDKLEKSLSPGTYPCTAYFHILDDSGTEINKIGVAITLEKEI